MKQPCVYILASRRNGTLYVGVTSNLVKRIWEHKNGLADGFTRRHDIHELVYFEQHLDMVTAIRREKQIKRWRRSWKLGLIEERNPYWHDLYETVI